MGKGDEIINGELRVSPRHIATLEADEIFVFGSNAQGMHLGGAACTAHMKFGAVWEMARDCRDNHTPYPRWRAKKAPSVPWSDSCNSHKSTPN